MIDVNSSYMENAGAATNEPSSFFRTMLALAALDAIMLFWILNPLSKPSNTVPSPHRLTAPQADHVTRVEPKPSPLGAVAKRVTTKTRQLQQARTYNPPAERRYVTVAYRQ